MGCGASSGTQGEERQRPQEERKTSYQRSSAPPSPTSERNGGTHGGPRDGGGRGRSPPSSGGGTDGGTAAEEQEQSQQQKQQKQQQVRMQVQDGGQTMVLPLGKQRSPQQLGTPPLDPQQQAPPPCPPAGGGGAVQQPTEDPGSPVVYGLPSDGGEISPRDPRSPVPRSPRQGPRARVLPSPRSPRCTDSPRHASGLSQEALQSALDAPLTPRQGLSPGTQRLVAGRNPRARSQSVGAITVDRTHPNSSGGGVSVAYIARLPSHPKLQYAMVDGVVEYQGQTTQHISYEDYARDLRALLNIVEDGPCRSVCRNRLKIIETKYETHMTLNRRREEQQTTMRWEAGGGIFATMKVDHHRLATCMNASYLVRAIQNKVRNHPDDVVDYDSSGHEVTLEEYLERNGVRNVDRLTTDSLGLMPGPEKMYHRFDIFSRTRTRGNLGSVEILQLFLKARNSVRGRYFAELVRPVLAKYSAPESQTATEMRVPMFGMNEGEWKYLASWIVRNDLRGSNLRWTVQIPRVAEHRFSPLYECKTVQDQLDHIFLPLWQATCNPTEHPEIADVLLSVGAFNVISDESSRVQDLPTRRRPPSQWDWLSENPPDTFFNYYVWANICAINSLRKSMGLNTFQFRPHCGEVGGIDHFVSAFLIADSIVHGISMQRNPVLCYLFYLTRTGIIMSPMSNNCLHLQPYHLSPFPRFARLGLAVCLATDDPLHFHHSESAVLEEYGTALKIFQLGSADLCEVARNSVLTSGFSPEWKRKHLGGPPPDGNDPTVTRVPQIRLKFRRDCLDWEKQILRRRLRLVGRRGSSQEPGDAPEELQLPELLRSRDQTVHLATGAAAPAVHSDDDQYNVEFHRVEILLPTAAGRGESDADCGAARRLRQGMALRWKYIWQHPIPVWRRAKHTANKEDGDWDCVFQSGVFVGRRKDSEPEDPPDVDVPVHYADFCTDFSLLRDIAEEVDVRSLAQRRLELLEEKYSLHAALNALDEGDSGQRNVADDQHRDFYQSYKVDTHIHMAAGMTATELLNFIIYKAENHGDDIVMMKDGEPISLGQFLESLGVDASRLTVDTLNVQADATLFERFDNFNDKYNPMGNPDLRTLLLKTDNYMGGRYFAELLKEVFTQLERSKFTSTEGRLSIYGRKRDEWRKLAGWFDIHGMNHTHNKWMIQVPRVYSVFRKLGFVSSFGEILENIFEPLWQVSINPASDPKLDHFLRHMSGFDSVDNESVLDSPLPENCSPDEWTDPANPPYAYWMYYMWVNISTLNSFRARKGLSTWDFRPHCGESGHSDHLAACFLTANSINHGINLALNPALEYLYYLGNMGLAVSPLSNNSLFLEYMKNPFPVFFRRGLNVSLSTDDPLQFHTTQEPLVEEYSIASKVWKLSPTDMCEIARNSVLQSGFDFRVKQKWLGEQFFLSSAAGNSCAYSHLPDSRVQYRYEAYHDEVDFLDQLADMLAGSNCGSVDSEDSCPRFMTTPEQEMRIQHEMHKAGMSSTLGRRTGARRGDVEDSSRIASFCGSGSVVVAGAASSMGTARQPSALFPANNLGWERERDALRKELEELRRELREAKTFPGRPPPEEGHRRVVGVRSPQALQLKKHDSPSPTAITGSGGMVHSPTYAATRDRQQQQSSTPWPFTTQQDSESDDEDQPPRPPLLGARSSSFSVMPLPRRPSMSLGFHEKQGKAGIGAISAAAEAAAQGRRRLSSSAADVLVQDYAQILVHGDDGGYEMDKAAQPISKALLMWERYRAANSL